MKEHGDLWNTYTVGYGEGSKDDELEDAKITADIFGTPNVSVRLTLKEFEKNIAETICTVEEPVATSSIVPMYYVSQRARQDVKVVLMGQGPDELFGGYTRHLGLGYGEYWRFLPAPVRKLLMSFSVLFPRNETLKRSIYSLNIEQRLQRYQNVFSIISGDQINSLFRKDILPFDYDFKVGQLWNDLLPYIKNTGELGGFQMIELRSSLPDELLIYGDKLSMRHGLEVRVPFLDKEIVEFVQRLPDNYKVRNGVGKWLHKKISRKYLPPKIINRRKRGFAYTVVDDWFRNTMSSRFGEIFDNVKSPIYTYLNNETVQHLYREHKAGKANNYKILFSIIVLEYIMEANG
jgi:asparagine synthase (glutamine-hydrolysing)